MSETGLKPQTNRLFGVLISPPASRAVLQDPPATHPYPPIPPPHNAQLLSLREDHRRDTLFCTAMALTTKGTQPLRRAVQATRRTSTTQRSRGHETARGKAGDARRRDVVAVPVLTTLAAAAAAWQPEHVRAEFQDLSADDSPSAAPAVKEATPEKKRPRGGSSNGLASTVASVAAGASITLILLQNPKGTEGAEVLARSAAFSSVKQSTSFLTYITWGLIGTFLTASVFAAM